MLYTSFVSRENVKTRITDKNVACMCVYVYTGTNIIRKIKHANVIITYYLYCYYHCILLCAAY